MLPNVPPYLATAAGSPTRCLATRTGTPAHRRLRPARLAPV